MQKKNNIWLTNLTIIIKNLNNNFDHGTTIDYPHFISDIKCVKCFIGFM